MLAKRLQVKLTSWYPHNYSEKRAHDHELEIYLWFDGRLAYKLFDYGPSDVVPKYGYFKGEYQPTIYPEVVDNVFKVRLVAIERDSPDPDDVSKGEIEINMNIENPPSSWTVITNQKIEGDLKIELNFDIEYLTYVNSQTIPEPGGPSIPPPNSPFPFGGDVTIFRDWLGLGLRKALPADPAHQHSQQIFFVRPLHGTGRSGKQITTSYRYGAAALGRYSDRISSIFIPHGLHATIYEHDFDDPRFPSGQSRKLANFGLYNMREIGLDDQVSAIEIVTVRFIPDR